MPEIQEVSVYRNIFFDLRNIIRRPGMAGVHLMAREIHQHLKKSGYMIRTDGSLICDKAPDVSTYSFVVDVQKYSAEVAKYVRDYSQSKKETSDLSLVQVAVIPVTFYQRNEWRDGEFGIVCSGGLVTHLVRIDGKFGKSDVLVRHSAIEAFKLLTD